MVPNGSSILFECMGTDFPVSSQIEEINFNGRNTTKYTPYHVKAERRRLKKMQIT